MQRKIFKRVCIIIIICVVGGFFLDKFFIKNQDSVNTNISSKMPIEVSEFLGKEMAEVKEQYQLEMDEIFGMALEEDNVSMLDSDEDGKIDGIYLNDREGDYTLFGMKCNADFNQVKIPLGYDLYDCTDVAASLTDAYTHYTYLSQDEQKVLVVDCWQNERIKGIALSFAGD